MNIKGIDKAKIIQILWNNSTGNSTVSLLAGLAAGISSMGYGAAKDILVGMKETGNYYIDYLFGRVMKIDLKSDDLDTWLYNRDNGTGKAEELINSIK